MKKKQNTFTHKTRTVARREAEAAGIDLDDVVILQDSETKLWGWVNADEHVKACEGADRPKRKARVQVETLAVEGIIVAEVMAPDAGILAVDMPESAADAGVVGHDETAGLDVESAIDAMPAAFDTGLILVGLTALDVPADGGDVVYASPVSDTNGDPLLIERHSVGDVITDNTGANVTVTMVDDNNIILVGEPGGGDTGEYEPEPTALGTVSNVVALNIPVQPNGEVVVQIAGGMLPMAARVMAAQLMKRYGVTIVLRDATTLELWDTIAPKQRSVAGGTSGGPRVVRDWSVRPVINSKHHMHVEKILDRIDDAASVAELEMVLSTFKPSCTYYKMAHRYGMAKLEEAREAGADGDEVPPGEVVRDLLAAD